MVFWAVFRETVRLALRSGGGAFVPLIFFLSVVAVTPFAIGPDPKLLSRVGPAVLWIGVLLSTLLGLDRLFRDDVQDGALDLHVVSGEPLEIYVMARACGHWLTGVLPLIVSAPLFGLTFDLAPRALGALTLSLAAGTPALTLIAAVGAALTAGLQRGGALVAVLVLPLTVPVLVFGVSMVEGALSATGSVRAPFLFLSAFTLAAAALAPFAGAAALRAALE